MYVSEEYKLIIRRKRAFESHRNRARRRWIAFEFEFEEWCAWWKQHLGPDWMKKRGSYAHQYVMARYFDDGPYAAHNVKCITASDNSREIRANMKKRYSRLRKFRIKHGMSPDAPLTSPRYLSR